MTDYHVVWEMDIDASSPREAAKQARENQVRTGTWAVVFDVGDSNGVITRVDLLEDESVDYIRWPSGEREALGRQHMERSP